MSDIEFRKALNYAFLLLKYRDRSRQEVIAGLLKKGYSQRLAQKVLRYLEENNLVNDNEFSKNYVFWAVDKGWGPRKIEFNLKKLGLDKNQYQDFLDKSDYSTSILELANKKYLTLKNKDISKALIQKRIIRYLAGRGFEYSQIFQELESFFNQSIFKN